MIDCKLVATVAVHVTVPDHLREDFQLQFGENLKYGPIRELPEVLQTRMSENEYEGEVRAFLEEVLALPRPDEYLFS